MDMLALMSVLIDQPFLALAPAALFFLAYAAYKSRWALAASLLWSFYCFYELAMRHRLLCSGECNIRIDLLVVYPALLVAVFARHSSAGWNPVFSTDCGRTGSQPSLG